MSEQVEIRIKTTDKQQQHQQQQQTNEKIANKPLSFVSIVRFIHRCTVQHQRNGMQQIQNVLPHLL